MTGGCQNGNFSARAHSVTRTRSHTVTNNSDVAQGCQVPRAHASRLEGLCEAGAPLARPPEFAKDSATIAASVVVPTVAKSVGDGEARSPEFAKDVAVSSGGAEPSWPRAKSTPMVVDAVVAKSRVPRQIPVPQCLLVKLGLLGLGAGVVLAQGSPASTNREAEFHDEA